jgi:hypothetical protein
MISDSALRRGALRGQGNKWVCENFHWRPASLDESIDALSLIAAKTTVFAYSTAFDDLDLGGEQPRKIAPLEFGASRIWVRCLRTDLEPPIPRRPFTKFRSEPINQMAYLRGHKSRRRHDAVYA